MKNAIHLVCFILFSACVVGCGSKTSSDATSDADSSSSEFVKVRGTRFEIHGKPYFFVGTNFWYGMNLGSKGAGGDRERLIRELDALQEMGVTNLRVVAGSEGPDSEPYRMVPAMQTKAGEYNMEVVDGLDFLLFEMKKRDMRAVMCLADFWNWSGGMGQYLVWSGAAQSIPYPPPHPGGDWGTYQEFVAQFYSNQKAVDMLNDHIRFVVNRTNAYSQIAYKDDPTIMAWELANEPRGVNNVGAYRKWISATTALIKQLDSNHLVTTGSEGTTSSPYSGTDPETDHSDPNVDYQTVHLWVQNWNIYDPKNADATYAPSVDYMVAYLKKHEAVSRKLNKPMVLEEFGISRDGNNHAADSPTSIRDKYYDAVLGAVYQYANEKNTVVSGVNFWAWAGEGRPHTPEGLWKEGHDFIGDPPHESQGWYSVYDKDSTTIDVIRKYAAQMNQIH